MLTVIKLISWILLYIFWPTIATSKGGFAKKEAALQIQVANPFKADTLDLGHPGQEEKKIKQPAISFHLFSMSKIREINIIYVHPSDQMK